MPAGSASLFPSVPHFLLLLQTHLLPFFLMGFTPAAVAIFQPLELSMLPQDLCPSVFSILKCFLHPYFYPRVLGWVLPEVEPDN